MKIESIIYIIFACVSVICLVWIGFSAKEIYDISKVKKESLNISHIVYDRSHKKLNDVEVDQLLTKYGFKKENEKYVNHEGFYITLTQDDKNKVYITTTHHRSFDEAIQDPNVNLKSIYHNKLKIDKLCDQGNKAELCKYTISEI